MQRTVAEFMNKKVATVKGDTSVYDAAKAMNDKKVGSLLIKDEEGGALGIITDKDVIERAILAGFDPRKVLVKDVMSTPLVVTRPSAPIVKAAEKMRGYRIKHLPVVDNGQLVGIITLTDLARAIPVIAEDKKALEKVMGTFDEHRSTGPYQ